MQYYDEDLDAYVEGPFSDERAKRNYLADRLRFAFLLQMENIAKTYRIVDMDSPRTANELVQRIKDGLYVVYEENGDLDTSNPSHWIRWRDPSKPADKDGYELAKQLLGKQRQVTMDTIKIGDPVDALKAVQDFEAATF